MVDNATEPLLLMSRHYESADILELCRLFMQNVYLKHYGRARLFAVLQTEYESQNLNALRSVRMLVTLFAITCFLQSPIYRFMARSCCLLMSQARSLRARLMPNR